MANSEECPICMEVLNDQNYMVICENEHQLCETCYKKIMTGNRSKKCPFDRQKMINWGPPILPQEVGTVVGLRNLLFELLEVYDSQRYLNRRHDAGIITHQNYADQSVDVLTEARRRDRIWFKYYCSVPWQQRPEKYTQCTNCCLTKHNRRTCPWKDFTVYSDQIHSRYF
jgi:hypothetical protein